MPISYDVQATAPTAAPTDHEPVDATMPPATGRADLGAGEAVGPDPDRYDSFGARVGAVKWEFAGMLALFSVVHVGTTLRDPQPLRFQDEGWFGRDTNNLGLDKLAHAYNTYIFSDLLYHRMARKAGGGLPTALASVALAAGMQSLGEVTDGFHTGSGFSVNDLAFNLAGGGFSVLRNSVPGLKEKLDFRLSVIPNRDFYTFKGKEHYRQQRYLFAVKLAGFDGVARSPLRFAEVHLGYYGTGFTQRERAAGRTPARKIFVGVGVNFGELLFKRSRSTAGRAARSVTQYFQLPYTTLRVK
ncbi:DUF2279 domain-containing protein [Sphingomonas qilianensis]|uniref:DUF2279 domain-containing protein n=1 Tax=Sphingomonas qilianensis TaxID=1736690 RepID=A0ABU9XSY6_9SPHN